MKEENFSPIDAKKWQVPSQAEICAAIEHTITTNGKLEAKSSEDAFATGEAKRIPERIIPESYNESDILKQVIIGYVENLYKNRKLDGSVDINNQKQAKNLAAGNLPTIEQSVPEFREFQRVLEEAGVEVLIPDPCGPETGVINQMTPRDIGFAIGDRFFISSMARPNRKREWESIQKFIDKMPEDKVIRVPENLVIEGGDIVVDKGNVYVGISQRTTEEGAEFLREQLRGTGFEVIPIKLKSIKENEDILHLDCAFVPVGKDSALIYSEGMTSVPGEILRDYHLIEVTREEQDELGTNVLNVSQTKVISIDATPRVNEEMRRMGIEVIEIPFNQARLIGGSLRCCSLPTIRVGENLGVAEKQESREVLVEVKVGDRTFPFERIVDEKDIEAAKEVDDKAFGQHKGISIEELRAIRDNGVLVGYYAENGKLIAQGQILLHSIEVPEKHELSEDEAYEYGIAVDPEFQLNGIGQALDEAMETIAREAGKRKFTATIRVENGKNMRVMTKNGFRIRDYDPNHYGLEAEGGGRFIVEKDLVDKPEPEEIADLGKRIHEGEIKILTLENADEILGASNEFVIPVISGDALDQEAMVLSNKVFSGENKYIGCAIIQPSEHGMETQKNMIYFQAIKQ